MADGRLTKEAISYSNAGYALFKLNGKIPAVAGFDWRKAEYVWPDEIEKTFGTWNGNLGVVLGKNDLVIDIDPRNFKPGDKPHVRLFQDAGIDIKGFAAVARTGSGGLHVYMRLPDGIKIKSKLPEYPGIDLKTKGGYVVSVGSLHPDTKKPYEWAIGLSLRDIKEAPPALVQIISRPTFGEAVATVELGNEGDADERAEIVERYVDYLEKLAPVAIQGEAGDHTTFTVACKGRDLGLSKEKTLELMLKHYNHRCIPDWTSGELSAKVRNAYQYAQGGIGADLPAADFTPVVQAQKHELFRGWDRQANGKLAKTLNNAFNFFITSDSPLRETLAYDEFNGQVKILRPLPWMKKPLPPGGAEWSDADTTQLTLWLSREREFDVKSTIVDQAVLAAAELSRLHPVRDYLRNLQWDGTPRLESWLIDYAGADDNRFTREASKKFLLQAVSRVYHPGCKADHVVVLEGGQGVGKSSLVEILGGHWYGDILIDPHARDTVDAMRGKWFIEFSEMEVNNRADAQALKAFITRKVDRVRLAYGRRSVDLPRQCVFVGTINPDATNEYLNDSTGGRRWWPVLIRQVKFAELAGVRDQLFAEAAELVLKGEATHIIDQEVIGLALEAQRARQTSDPWTAAIGDFITDKSAEFLTTKDIWVYALKGSESNLNVSHQRRIANCLKDLGFIPHVKRDKLHGGRITRGFVKMELVEKAEKEPGWEMFN